MPNEGGSETTRWETWQQQFKNGDVYLNDGSAKTIELRTLLVREMDGSVSVLIVQGAGRPENEKDFLYQRVKLFGSWEECVCLFPYDIGSDGTLHSVKGLGTEIHPFAALDNKIKNALADLVTTGMRPMFQPANGNDAQKFQLLRMGGYNIVPAGVTVMQGFQNIAAGIMPALEVSQAFSAAYAKNTGSYNRDIAAPTVEETAKAAMIRAHERSKLNQGAFNRHYCGMDREYRERWRRAINPSYRAHHRGGPEALVFQAECKKACDKWGVGYDVLKAVTNVRAVRDIGLGSPGIRIEIANALMDPNFYDRLDPVGQHAAKRAFVSTLTSYHSADVFVPPLEEAQTPTQEDKIAIFENNDLETGGQADVFPRENHEIHLQRHIGRMEEASEELPPREALAVIDAIGPHAADHFAFIKSNPTKKKWSVEFGTRLQALGKIADQFRQNIEEADQAGAQAQEQSPEMVKVQLDAQRKDAKQAADLARKSRQQGFNEQVAIEKLNSEIAVADVQAASSIRRENAKARAQQPEPAAA